MTGYSRAQVEAPDLSLSVTLKSTNHRFLDLQVRLPGGLDSLEPLLRTLVKEHVARGHIELGVTLEKTGTTQLQVNRKLLDAYISACDEVRTEYGYTSEPDLVALLRVPGIVGGIDGEPSPGELESIQRILEGVATQALGRLNQMRDAEGTALERDVRSRLRRLRDLRESVATLASKVPNLYRLRLEGRVRELIDSRSGNPDLDAGRLSQEVVYLASRSDIAEELTRLHSHLDQADRLLDEGPEVGKKLDFLLQEMNREANTVLSKTTDVPEAGPEIARQAIEMKTEIEKLREQAQNIE